MTKNLTLHTPTPWKVVENGFKTQFIYGSDATQKKSPMGVPYNELVAGGDHPSTLCPANAAFIVKACNEHDALRRRVVALEMIISEDLHPDDCSDDLNRMIVEEIWALKKVTPTLTSADRGGAS